MRNVGFNDYELVYLARQHNEKAIEILYKKYIDVFSYQMYQFKVGWKDYDYLTSEGRQLIYYCIRVYNKDVPFYPFFKLCAKRLISKYFRKKRVYEVNFDNFMMMEDIPDYEDEEPNDLKVEFTNKFQETICEMYANGMRLIDIAKELNLSPKKIYYEFEKIKKYNNP